MTPTQDKRALDEHQAVAWSDAAADVNPPVVGLRSVGIVYGVVNAVDLACLTPVGRRGQSEVGVAARSLQDLDLVIDTAAAAVGSPIIKGPHSVHKTVS